MTGPDRAEGPQSLLGRLRSAYAVLPGERRPALLAALGLFLTLFLPWYQRQYFALLGGRLQPASDVQSAWQAFSFVEAAILVVALGVLVLLFQRAEGRDFHVPGSDGSVILAAGCWVCLLVVWRIFDKQGATSHAHYATSYGIEWGIFLALADAAVLAWSGARIRAGERAILPSPRGGRRPSRDRRPRPEQRSPEWAPVEWGGAPTSVTRATAAVRAERTRSLTERRATQPASTGPVPDVSEPPEMPRPRPRKRQAESAEQLTIPFDEQRPHL